MESVGPSCEEVLSDTLARGMVYWLLRAGGWQTQIHGHPSRQSHYEAPVAEHHAASSFALDYSANSLVVLMDTVNKSAALQKTNDSHTLGDDLVFALCCTSRSDDNKGANASLAIFKHSPLSWLLNFKAMANAGVLPSRRFSQRLKKLFPKKSTSSDWQYGTIVLEMLQPLLAKRWSEAERYKREIKDPAALTSYCEKFETVLGEYTDAVLTYGQPSLTNFMIDTFVDVLQPGPSARWWTPNLGSGTLKDRQSALIASASLLRLVNEHLRPLYYDYSNVQFFEPEFDHAQKMLLRWERILPDKNTLGMNLFDRSAAICSELSTLDALDL